MGERWNQLQLQKDGTSTGGEQLRMCIRQTLRGEPLATQIDGNGSSWALAADLLERYVLPFN
jgi:hypothetical protein